jgi:hypothetical protein
MADITEPVDLNGFLTPEALAHIGKHLGEKLTQSCPSCGRHEFVVANRIYAPPALGRRRGIDYGNTYPLVMVLCSNCAYVLPFAARVMGLFGDTSDEQ